MPDKKGDKKPGKVGLHCIGGVIEHLPALTAIGCSTVNSYRRLWGHRLLGARLRRLGLSKTALAVCACRRPVALNIAPLIRRLIPI